MKAQVKWSVLIIALAIVGFLVITSPGWSQVLGIQGNEQATLTAFVVMLTIGAIGWVIASGGAGK